MPTDWAKRRKRTILLIVGVVVVAVVTIILTAVLYKAPSCSDNKQNQDEAGVDCGGSCAYRCTTQEIDPTVLFALPLRNSAGRTDLIASVENKNTDAAAKKVSYSAKLYTSDVSFIREVTGTLDLPPRTTVPIYIPGIASGVAVARVVFSIDTRAVKWYTMAVDPRIVPVVSHSTLGGTQAAPRVEAELTNSSITTLSNVHAIVMIHGTSGNIIAASETILPTIPAQGQATALFTWNEAFPGTPSRIQVEPVIPLP